MNIPKIVISPSEWAIVHDILQRHVPGREVWAFGSRAKWTSKEFSDLDLAIIGDESLSITTLASLSEDFSESELPYKVDIVDWATTSPSFRKVVKESKVLVQQSDNTSGWSELSVSDIAEITPSRNLKKGIASPFIEMAALSADSRDIPPAQIATRPFSGSGSRFMDGDVLLARITPCLENGKTALVSGLGKAVVGHGSTEFIVLAARDTSEQRFIYYLARHPDFREYAIQHMEGTSGRQRVSAGAIGKYRFLCPPPQQRKEIGEMLGILDDKIVLLRETNATLESIAKALFKSWFVDFDPVRAKAEGREPEGIPPDIAALFPSEFEDYELGEIPKGWKAEPFGKLLDHMIGGDWGKDEPDTEHSVSVAIIRGTDIPDIKVGNIDSVPRRFVSPKKLVNRRLQDGDLIIEVSGGSKTQATGRSLYCTDAMLCGFETAVVPASFCRLLRPSNKHIGLVLAIHLSSIYAAGKMWGYQVQSTGLANFQTSHFLESELVIVPPEPILSAFYESVRPLVERQQSTDIRMLASLRDTLLPRLMSGKLRLPEIQEAAGETTA